MPYKDPAKQKEAQARHYRRFKEKYQKSSKAAKDRRHRIMLAAKDQPCMDCGGEYHPAVMHFHHRDPTTKIATVRQLVDTSTIKAINEEIAKCDVLCANCHAMRHVELRSRQQESNLLP